MTINIPKFNINVSYNLPVILNIVRLQKKDKFNALLHFLYTTPRSKFSFLNRHTHVGFSHTSDALQMVLEIPLLHNSTQ